MGGLRSYPDRAGVSQCGQECGTGHEPQAIRGPRRYCGPFQQDTCRPERKMLLPWIEIKRDDTRLEFLSSPIFVCPGDPNAKIIEEDKASYWDLHGVLVAKDKLPKTSAQMEFDRGTLPEVYDFLDQLS